MQSQKVRVLVADDHEIVRYGLVQALKNAPDFQVIGEATNGREACSIFAKTPVDIVILDLTMPEMNGLECLSLIKKTARKVKIVFLTMHLDENLIHRVVEHKPDGYLLKNTSKDEIISTLRKIWAGERVFSNSVYQALGKKYALEANNKTKTQLSLTKREREILDLLSKGMTSPEISELLFISSRTVDTHRFNMMKKMGAKNTTSLLHEAKQLGLLNML